MPATAAVPPAGRPNSKGQSVVMNAPNAPSNSTKPSASFARGGSRLAPGSAAGSVVDVSQSVASDAAKKAKKPRTMEELDRRVEQDALELVNMKRDIVEQQKQESKKAMSVLMDIKKEYDGIRVVNTRKKKDFDDLKDKVSALKVIDKNVHDSSHETQNICQSLTKQLASVEENCAAEARTLEMQVLMIKRLQSDIGNLRVESGEVGFNVDKTQYELNSIDNTLQLSRTELNNAELKLDAMAEQGKGRAKERRSKMTMLQSIVEQGETSLSVVQNSIFDQSRTGNGSPGAAHKGGQGSPDRQDFKYNLGPNDSPPKVGNNNRQQYNSLSPNQRESTGTTGIDASGGLLSNSKTGTPADRSRQGSANRNKKEEEEDFDVSANDPKQQAQRMTLDQIEELVDRFRTREFRMEKLEQLENDLKNNMSKQKEHKNDLEHLLEACKNKVAALASQRQVYQEVDNKANALSAARKESEECKDRDYRLTVNLDALKRAVPRLLAKLTKITHPVPSDLQLPDAINRLSIEISRCFKDISGNIIKDATAEDVASMHREDDETQSEIDKLHKLPGFSRLQKELFFNMMGARPDNSDANVRITSKMARSGRGVTGGASKANSTKFAPQPPTGGKSEGGVTHQNHHVGSSHSHAESPVIDRSTAKMISALVFQRDGKGLMPVKKEKKKVKKYFEFKG